MSVFTVHEPPRRTADAPSDPDRFAFVRDGFSIWAFLFAPLWMLLHRMWLVLAGYVAVSIGLETLVKGFGASASIVGGIGLLLSFLVGLEAGTLRRFTLSRRGWNNVGVVSGDGYEDAERRFFDAWVREGASQKRPSATAASASGGPAAPTPYTRRSSDVIGLFPEPGTQR
jgi:hypothetical protein